MVSQVIACERLGEHGELRGFVRDGPPQHLAFEIFRDADGRAWTLRVPLADHARLERLTTVAAARLARGGAPALAEDGTATLARETLSNGDEVVALVLEQDGERVFALWRREPARDGWSWTLDAVFVPEALAEASCAVIRRALAQ
jgi:hypothetical protein